MNAVKDGPGNLPVSGDSDSPQGTGRITVTADDQLFTRTYVKSGSKIAQSKLSERSLSLPTGNEQDTKSHKTGVPAWLAHILAVLSKVFSSRQIDVSEKTNTVSNDPEQSNRTIDKAIGVLESDNAFKEANSTLSAIGILKYLKEVKSHLERLAGGNQGQLVTINNVFGKQIENLCIEKSLNLFEDCTTADSIQEQLKNLNALKELLVSLAGDDREALGKVNEFIGKQIENLCTQKPLNLFGGCKTVNSMLTRLNTLKESLESLAGDDRETLGKVNEFVGALFDACMAQLGKVYTQALGKITTVEDLEKQLETIQREINNLKSDAGALGNESAVKIQETISRAFGNRVRDMLEQLSKRCGAKYEGEGKIDTVEELKYELGKLNSLSERMCDVFFGDHGEDANAKAYGESDAFRGFYDEAVNIFGMVNDKEVNEALAIEISAEKPISDLKALNTRVEGAQVKLLEYANGPIQAIQEMLLGQIAKRHEFVTNNVAEAINTIHTKYSESESNSTSKDFMKQIFDATQELKPEDRKMIYSTLPKEIREQIVAHAQCVIAEMNESVVSNHMGLAKENVQILINIINLNELLPEKPLKLNDLLSFLPSIIKYAEEQQKQGLSVRSTLSPIVGLALSAFQVKINGSQKISEGELTNILQLLSLSGISGRSDRNIVQSINVLCRKFLDEKIDTKENFQAYIKQEGNLEKFTLMASFLFANNWEGGLSGLISSENVLKIGEVNYTPEWKILKSGQYSSGGKQVNFQNNGLAGMIADEKDPFMVNLLLSLLEVPDDRLVSITDNMLKGNRQHMFQEGQRIFCSIQSQRALMGTEAQEKQLDDLIKLKWSEGQRSFLERMRQKTRPTDVHAACNVAKLYFDGKVNVEVLATMTTLATLKLKIANMAQALETLNVTSFGRSNLFNKQEFQKEIQAIVDLIEFVRKIPEEKRREVDGFDVMKKALDDVEKEISTLSKAIKNQKDRTMDSGGVTLETVQCSVGYGDEPQTGDSGLGGFFQRFQRKKVFNQDHQNFDARTALYGFFLAKVRGLVNTVRGIVNTNGMADATKFLKGEFAKEKTRLGRDLSPEEEMKVVTECITGFRKDINYKKILADLNDLQTLCKRAVE
ncbi:MAG: hypothetical protein LBB16_00025 [Puniceicoccales bacterium]|jgi:hypothetical protein|nr:hypothetical protein [Puniceicoccales bacterium]